MDFLAFCRAHGILIDAVPRLGVWRRYPTEDHPNKRNGAVKFMGDHAFVQNHATAVEVSVWKTDVEVKIDRQAIANQAKRAEDDIRRKQRDAASKAEWILKQCQYAKHYYLKAKGFPDEQGNIWRADDALLLVIPMRVTGRVVGCQLIDEAGAKKFLFGQRTSNAEFVFGTNGKHILCEGYATALSVRLALKNMKIPYCLHVCFSAGNMVKIAAGLPGGYIIADNDASGTGERVAKQIGWPYWMPPEVGMDANDWQQKVGTFRFSQDLRKLLLNVL